MQKLLYGTIIAASAAVAACATGAGSQQHQSGADIMTVSDGHFVIGDSAVRPYIGVNMWYAPILASDGRGGDRVRLERELDMLQSLGVTNLRVLAGGDGREGLRSHIEPVLQTAPGIYNDTLLRGLDYLLDRLEQRGMTAVIYLNNAWEWSGGYGTYLEWAGAGEAPIPANDGWPAYMEYAAGFLRNDSAKAMFARHIDNIVGRVSSVNGRPYAESPAIMAWQIANEPRAFSDENKPMLLEWIESSARRIKAADPNHMVSVGSEGSHGCETDIDLWAAIHALPDIDYATIHIWPYNWGWVDSATTVVNADSAAVRAAGYVSDHAAISRRLGKPLVLEEFGYPRDFMRFEAGTPTHGRDRFYTAVFEMIGDSTSLAGCNLWGWGGHAAPRHIEWQPGDPYTGDPAQEQQGLNSIFATDTTTLDIIGSANKR
ncbi:MAG: cellulase family glycosylhydrolase [Bacteroidales bacterium]|nr:cellulase family glycosylhydrolase [Bacteroidales bacterium]